MSQQSWGAPPPPRTPNPGWDPRARPPAGWSQGAAGRPAAGWTPAPQQFSSQGGWPAPQQQPQWQTSRQAQQSPWQAPQQPQWRPPAPKRGNGLRNLLFAVLALVAALALASFLQDLLSPSTQTTPPSQGGQTTPLSPYQNEGYVPPPVEKNPPPLPGPRNLDAAERLVSGNPLYDQSVPVPTNCAMDTTTTMQMSASEMEKHFNELMGCLMAVYEGPVEEASFILPRPPVTVYTAPIKTACGDFDELNAAYCTGDQRIYYAGPLLKAFPASVQSTPFAAEMILSHEFGHAVQARTAILISGSALEQYAASEEAAQELSRRLEVQADCLAGAAVRSMAQSQDLDAGAQQRLAEMAHQLGDDVLTGQPGFSAGHGTGGARQDWFTRGLNTESIGTCNTYVAAADEVR